MLKQLTTIAATLLAGMLTAQGTITPVLTPASGETVTNLATIKVTFEGMEFLTKPKLAEISASLTNETTGTKYVCTKVDFNYMNPNIATMQFGVEGTTTSLGEIKEDGTYKLSIAAGSFKSSETDGEQYPEGYKCPLIEATYTIGGEAKDEMYNYTLTPAVGEVTEINTIKVDFPDTGFMGIKVNSTADITLTFNNGRTTHVAKVAKHIFGYESDCQLQFDWDDAQLQEPMTFIAPGTYTLDIPAGAFSDWNGKLNSRHITATYTITSNGRTCSVIPSGGAVNNITTIELNFGGNEVNTLQLVEDLSPITITRKGELKTVWHCINAVKTGSDSYVRLTFAREGSSEAATIDAPGEYLLSVPANMMTVYTTAGRVGNNPVQVLYTIAKGANHMNTFTFNPDGEKLAGIRDIKITFPDALDGLVNPIETKDITLTFTPADSDAVTETYKPNGFEISGNTATLKFGTTGLEPFTANGIYLLQIPEKTFIEYCNPDSYSPAIEKSFVVSDGTTGVDEFRMENEGETVYNLQGVMVRRAGENHPLPAGIYIKGGRKIVMK